ncbi:Translin, partial [Mucor mucedo]|uniref:Translin n=1 Tax=Mucor mucedo TaxID=29922 RepID=UPI00221E9F4E
MDPQIFFTECRDILDAHHDRRERIIKVSRDITAQSKKMIFALHRASQMNHKEKFKEVDKKQEEIISLFKKLAQDIQGLDYHRYSRSFSGGFEEFIEAIAFYHFLVHQNVITKDQVDAYFIDKETDEKWLTVKTEDYILGLADFTGELMRYAIYVVSTGNYDQAMLICKLLRKIDTDFELIASAYMPQLFKKMGALKGSIKKVEQACYTFQIRGSEYPKEMYLTIIKDHQEKYEQQN